MLPGLEVRYSALLQASILGTLGDWMSNFITKATYDEVGPGAAHAVFWPLRDWQTTTFQLSAKDKQSGTSVESPLIITAPTDAQALLHELITGSEEVRDSSVVATQPG